MVSLIQGIHGSEVWFLPEPLCYLKGTWYCLSKYWTNSVQKKGGFKRKSNLALLPFALQHPWKQSYHQNLLVWIQSRHCMLEPLPPPLAWGSEKQLTGEFWAMSQTLNAVKGTYRNPYKSTKKGETTEIPTLPPKVTPAGQWCVLTWLSSRSGISYKVPYK